MVIKPRKVLCKKTDEKYVTEGKWYYVVRSINDLENTFTIIDNRKKPHLFFIYEDYFLRDEHDMIDKNQKFKSRDYAKWFYQ